MYVKYMLIKLLPFKKPKSCDKSDADPIYNIIIIYNSLYLNYVFLVKPWNLIGAYLGASQ